MLLNNFHPDKDDRFYFLFRFAVRTWLLFLSVIISVPLGDIFGRSITGKQFITMCGGFVLVLVLDFISVWIRAYAEYKEIDRMERENFGFKKSR